MSSCREGHCAIGPVMSASGRSMDPNLGSINTGFSVSLSVYLTSSRLLPVLPLSLFRGPGCVAMARTPSPGVRGS